MRTGILTGSIFSTACSQPDSAGGIPGPRCFAGSLFPIATMPSTLVSIALSVLLVSGLYSAMMWLDLLGMRRLVFWRRVAVSSVISHSVLFGVFMALAFVDFRATSHMIGTEVSFSAFLFSNPDFWRVFLLFDTLPAILVLGILGVLDAVGSGAGAILPAAVVTVLLAGSVQWYAVGALVGTALARLVSGLRTPEDEMPDWF